jgi:hypothetical protein
MVNKLWTYFYVINVEKILLTKRQPFRRGDSRPQGKAATAVMIPIQIKRQQLLAWQ